MRLDALLSRYGYCSRREAPGWIKRHTVTFKGKPCSAPTDKVQAEGLLLDGEPVEFPDGLYAALYKPAGYTCSHDDEEGDLIYDLLPFRWRHRNPAVSSAGRLDKETSGLLLLTDDGHFIHRMTSPRHHVAKIYEAVTKEDIPTGAVDLFSSGTLTLNGEARPCAPALLEIREPRRARLTLTEGKYHQVRRMLAAVGAPVLSLCRVSIGSLHLDSLNLKPAIQNKIRRMAAISNPVYYKNQAIGTSNFDTPRWIYLGEEVGLEVWDWAHRVYNIENLFLKCLICSALIVITVVDWRTFEIPLGANIFIFVIGIIKLISTMWVDSRYYQFYCQHAGIEPTFWQILNGNGKWLEYVLGFFMVSFVLWLIYVLSKGRAIGGGDVKLMAVAGLFLGWKLNLVALIFGCLYGSVIHIIRMKKSGEGKQLAMGPYLSAGIVTAMWFGNSIITWYSGFFS